MTETSSLLTTYSIPNSYQVTALPTAVSPLPNGHGNLSPENVAEEEYTIKCICGYDDDDGNTVFCEKCDTWQHIECFYHQKAVPEIHLCIDCAPKETFGDISAEKARERQRRARELLEGGGDRRVKKPASKTQKKKHRDTVTVNGFPNGWTNHERQDSLPNPRDQPPPAKKPKTSHRASGSIASLNGESRKRAHSNVQSYPSPSKSPQESYRYPIVPQYTSEFLELYDRDEGNAHAKDNEYTIKASQHISTRKADLSVAASQNGNTQKDKNFLIRTASDWDERVLPSVELETCHGKEIDSEGKCPTWKLLRLRSEVSKGDIVGEVRGQVGMLDEYCHQVFGPNRWKDLSHPDPFVFFHPLTSIYIDSRRSGTQFRYIRRSCDPNVTMRSYLTADDQVHHCFVANQDLPAGTELTATWYVPDHIRIDGTRDDKEDLYFEHVDYFSRILANFGDCACTLSKCRLDNYDRRSSMKPPDLPKAAGGRKKKTKTKHAISPLSTGQATNSRAGSETVKGQEEDDDHRSSSGSSRNGVRSRDLTPQGGALLDEPPILGDGLTARERRKILALEKASENRSQKVEKKQKKRPSGASVLSTPNTTASKQLGSGSTAENKQASRSPPPNKPPKDISNRSTPSKIASKPVRPVYVSVSVQTEPESCVTPLPPFKKRRFCTPTQRLLKKLLNHQVESKPTSPEYDCENGQSQEHREDVEMRDVTTSISTSTSTKSSPTIPDTISTSSVSASPQAPLPSQAAHTHAVHGLFKTPAPRLSLSTLPPVPMFSNATSATPGTASTLETSSAGTPSVVQSPGIYGASSALVFGQSSAVNPSPAKKKLSLGDYMSRRKESSMPSIERPGLNLAEFSDSGKERTGSESRSESDGKDGTLSTADVAQAKAAENEQAVDDTPMADVTDSISRKSPEVVKQDASSNSVAANVQHMLSSLHQMQNKQDLGHI